ncbi:MAG TPA: hypothetical protein VKR06_33755 [Ktedonosporobacter sp.]|nr:hypothetical protein [Ktedonosporobacter sp.]
MGTQAIKRWLYKLFSWWPWKHSPEGGYPQVVSNVNQGQGPLWQANGSMPQPGMASVVVEQGREEKNPETSRSTIDERSDRITQQKSPAAEENANTSLTSLPFTEGITSRGESPPPAPTQEQQLAFLQYLVRRGLVNEGFAEGQTPEQYRRKR